MPPVTRYKSHLAAQQAAAYLTSHGIVARAIPADDAYHVGSNVEITNAAQVPMARTLLNKFDLLKPEYLQPLEDQATPDLSRLPPSLQPTCSRCAGLLPLDAMVTRCVVCGKQVNVVERIVEQHGPEALEVCYDEDPDGACPEYTDEQIGHMEFSCQECGYPLKGLAVRDRCPECGRPYSKRKMLEAGISSVSIPGSSLSDEQVSRLPLFCASCRYSLVDLPVKGVCPECGAAYSKRSMIGG